MVLLGITRIVQGQSTLSSISDLDPALGTRYTEAPAGFDEQTNGLLTQEEFDQAAEIFAEVEERDEGLGPIYNADSCGGCHQNPVLGGSSQVTELRAGRWNGVAFTEHVGGSLINDRAIDSLIQEHVLKGNNVRALRLSLNVLGDGYVEAIADETLKAIADNQPTRMRGEMVMVPVLEAGGALRAGRFGWKNQHASLLSFSADAYLNEMGITSPMLPAENTSNGQPVADYDATPDPEDLGEDLEFFAGFMRSTKAPPRDAGLAATPAAQAGARLFRQIGCVICHVASIATAPPGTPINGGLFTVPPSLGNKIIHPYSDFLLHDIGTGDGIVQNGPATTRNKVRTAPLWGLRTRPRMMHDGASLTLEEAIGRHGGEAAPVTDAARRLTSQERAWLIKFLESL
jgi:CxxC motif-containing protein (DUF1111 family)